MRLPAFEFSLGMVHSGGTVLPRLSRGSGRRQWLEVGFAIADGCHLAALEVGGQGCSADGGSANLTPVRSVPYFFDAKSRGCITAPLGFPDELTR
jgi:hypothetical protein